MAKPIQADTVLKGKAAKQFKKYIETAKPDAAKAARLAEAKESHERIKVIPA